VGLVAFEGGDDARAEALAGESLALRQELGDCGGAANALNTLGVIARLHGAYARAFEMLYESLALKRALGDAWGVAYALNTLGVAAREQGRPEEAHALHEEALALFQAVHGAPGVADALRNLALVAREQGMTTHASRNAVTTVQREDPELRFAVDQAIASARLEGIKLRPYVLAAAERLVRGEISIDELVEIILRG